MTSKIGKPLASAEISLHTFLARLNAHAQLNSVSLLTGLSHHHLMTQGGSDEFPLREETRLRFSSPPQTQTCGRLSGWALASFKDDSCVVGSVAGVSDSLLLSLSAPQIRLKLPRQARDTLRSWCDSQHRLKRKSPTAEDMSEIRKCTSTFHW